MSLLRFNDGHSLGSIIDSTRQIEHVRPIMLGRTSAIAQARLGVNSDTTHSNIVYSLRKSMLVVRDPVCG